MKVPKYRTWTQLFSGPYSKYVSGLSIGMLCTMIKSHSEIVTIQKLKGEKPESDYPDYPEGNLAPLMLKVELKELKKRGKL